TLLTLPLFSPLHRRPPRPPLFPYTTLFRSSGARIRRERGLARTNFRTRRATAVSASTPQTTTMNASCSATAAPPSCATKRRLLRSEEHTSELQSRFDLVCRLLLEKKKKQIS